jgi:hypothetical protein
MTSNPGTDAPPRRPSVFLSYASGDRQAARALRDALPGLGLEVWYDESELGGGEAWDQKIRRQIRECDYFMPLVSAQTEARAEGYFRREWRLAVERTLDMADDHTFLLPIVIDDTDQATARVPEKFLTVQWLRVPGGQPTPAFEAMCRRVAAGQSAAPPRVRGERAQPAGYPDRPQRTPGPQGQYRIAVLRWALRRAWLAFQRVPRWVRVLLYIWLILTVLSRGCSGHHPDAAAVSPATAEKLQGIASQFQGSMDKGAIAKLGAQIAREFADTDGAAAPDKAPLLAIPFAAPAADVAAANFASSTFALVYGRVAISHHGQVGLPAEPLLSPDFGAALERARANHSAYVLYGTVESPAAGQVLSIRIGTVEDGSVVWTRSYPLQGADPAKIAAEVDAAMPALDDT